MLSKNYQKKFSFFYYKSWDYYIPHLVLSISLRSIEIIHMFLYSLEKIAKSSHWRGDESIQEKHWGQNSGGLARGEGERERRRRWAVTWGRREKVYKRCSHILPPGPGHTRRGEVVQNEGNVSSITALKGRIRNLQRTIPRCLVLCLGSSSSSAWIGIRDPCCGSHRQLGPT